MPIKADKDVYIKYLEAENLRLKETVEVYRERLQQVYYGNSVYGNVEQAIEDADEREMWG